MADVEGLHLKITGDSSQAVGEIKKVANATTQLKDTKIKLKTDLLINLDDLGKKIENGLGTILKGITAGVTAVSTAIGLITKNAMSIGGAFEAQITNVKVISGATEEELDMLIKKAREMGAALPITAKDAATAMELLAQRGTKAKDILASVADVSSLAISQSVDMGSAADLLGSTMTNFGMSIDTATKITDMFNNASNQSSLNISKLIEAMKYVGPAAGSLGMNLSEALAAMEVLANAGLTGEMIGTGLTMTLTKLAKASQVLGVQTKNLDGTMRPLKDIFTELQAKGFSVADASKIFGDRAKLAVLNLVKYSSSLEENEKNLQKWGSTQAAVNEKMKAWPNVWNAFKSATEEVHIEIFTQIKEQSKEAVSGVAELTREFSKWINKTQIAGQSLNAFIEGLGFRIPSNASFQELLESFDVQRFVDNVKSFGATIKSIGSSIGNFFSAVKTPLLFLIEHLDTFAKISFWGWIVGKGAQIPVTIMNLASSFTKLYNSVKALIALNAPLAGTVGTLTAGIALLAVSIERANAKYHEVVEILNAERQITEVTAKIQELEKNSSMEEAIQTGFEDLPDKFKDVKNSLIDINGLISELQNSFKEKIIKAVQNVIAKFPEMAESFKGTAKDINDTIATQITHALQGSEEEFKALPLFWKNVVEELAKMGVKAGQVSGDVNLLIKCFHTFEQEVSDVQNKLTDVTKQDEFTNFSEEITRSLERLFIELPSNFERIQKFLGNDNNLELALNISFSQAQEELKKFIKSTSEKYSISEKIVEESTFSRLKKFAAQGDIVAKALAQGWKGAGNELNNFIERAEDAINYLNMSPEKFTPVLNTMAKGIQKIDSTTGKVTEQFKKAYDTLKQWSNITFSQLTQRIQRLKKAVEGGFIDKSALEDEFKRVSKQVKLQVVTELEPTKNMYSSRGAYESVLASEYISKLTELGGETFADMARKEFSNLFEQSGTSMGRYIADEVQKILRNENKEQNLNFNVQDISQAITNSFSPFVAKLEQINTQQPYQNETIKDYSSAINQIVTAIREVTEAVKSQKINVEYSNNNNNNFSQNFQSLEDSINSLKQSNENNFKQTQDTIRSINISSNQQDFTPVISALSSSNSGIIEAVNSVETAIKSMTSSNTYNIEINQQGFMIQQKSDADTLARSTVSALRTGFGNGGL